MKRSTDSRLRAALDPTLTFKRLVRAIILVHELAHGTVTRFSCQGIEVSTTMSRKRKTPYERAIDVDTVAHELKALEGCDKNETILTHDFEVATMNGYY